MKPKLYLIGSLRNQAIPEIANQIEAVGMNVFADWHCAGERADDAWQDHETRRGKTYAQALEGLAAKHVFQFDKFHLDSADAGVLVLPAGKSGHLELGYLAGQGKPTWILFNEEPARWDQMYQFASGVHFSLDTLISAVQKKLLDPPRKWWRFRFHA